MKIKWLGHSSFKFTSNKGVQIITDPFDQSVGYAMPNEQADIVTSSHEHFDHNHQEAVKGSFEYIDKSGAQDIKGIHIDGMMTYHDKTKGLQRGKNIVFTYEIDGIRLCHMGDLGHTLNKDQINSIGSIDVLMLPVGGHFTIDAEEAMEIIAKLNPKLVIPMHFKTEVVNFPIAPTEEIMSTMNGERIGKREIDITQEELAGYDKKVILMEYK